MSYTVDELSNSWTVIRDTEGRVVAEMAAGTTPALAHLFAAAPNLLERVKRLEAVATEARAMHATGEFVLSSAERFDKEEIAAIARGDLQVKDAVFPPSYKWRLDNLGAALRALEGGGKV